MPRNMSGHTPFRSPNLIQFGNGHMPIHFVEMGGAEPHVHVLVTRGGSGIAENALDHGIAPISRSRGKRRGS